MKKGVKYFTPEDIAVFLGVISFYCLFILWPLDSKLSFFLVTGLGILLVSILFFCEKNSITKQPFEIRLYYLSAILSLSAIGVILFYQERITLDAVNPIASLGLLYGVSMMHRNHMRAALYIVLIFSGGGALCGIDVDQSVIVIGQNGLTLHILVLYVLYFFRFLCSEQAGRWTLCENFGIAALILTISVWSQGRAATITSFVILGVAALMLMQAVQLREKAFIFSIAILIFALQYFSPLLMGQRTASGVDRIVMGGVFDVRYAIWADYFQTLSPNGILMGNRESNCHKILLSYTRQNCNVHSSYLRAHQVYGLVGCSVIALTILSIFVWLWRNKKRSAAVVFFAVLLRVSTDEAFFTYSYLFVLFFVLMQTSGENTR